MSWRLTEQEAYERGYIKKPASMQVPPPAAPYMSRRHIQLPDTTIYYILLFLLGWFIGFAMGLRVGM